MCSVLHWAAAGAFFVYAAIGAWAFYPATWKLHRRDVWGGTSDESRTVRARLQRVGLLRWLALPVIGLVLIALAGPGC